MYPIQKAYNDITKKVKGKIESEKESVLIGNELNELIDYYFSLDNFSPIELDKNIPEEGLVERGFHIPEEMFTPKDFFEENHDFTTEEILVRIPIKDNCSYAGLQQFCSPIGNDAAIRLRESYIGITVQIKGVNFSKDNNTVSKEILTKKQVVYDWVDSLNQQIINLNQHLRSDIQRFLENRISTIQATEKRYQDLSEIINTPLTKKTDAVVTKIKLDKSPLVRRIKPMPSHHEVYILDRNKVLDIIHVIDNQGYQFEKTPNTYLTLGEEQLRNILLVNLNTIFEGKAVGEAFSHRGKTDIFLHIVKGNILVAECKIWSGKKDYLQAISQVLSYLTWRNSFAILITFCRGKNMSRIIAEAGRHCKEHSTFLEGPKKMSSSHFFTTHHFPNDRNKTIEIHHVFYDLCPE